jgi:Xaa-Pro aminopeptidase
VERPQGRDDAVDVERLRVERLERLQAAMRRHDLGCCVLSNEPNVRYATGATAMPVYAMSTFVRCAVVPQEGTPILFEHANSVHRSAVRAPDVRPMHAWEFYDDPQHEADTWADEVLAAVRELGSDPTRLAVDRLGTPGFRALERSGVSIVDSAPATQEARRVKTPQELLLLDRNGALVLEMLHAFQAEIAPGVRERDLLATLAAAMLRGGGEYLATTTVYGGPNTNPWRAEATERSLRPGEVVFVDTDTVGIEGMFSCVSRTFLVGDARPSHDARETFRAAHAWLLELEELVRPGITCGELAAEAPALPERFLPQRYECMIHGIGLEEENPSVCYPQDRQSNADTTIEEHMALVVELYAGAVGADHGVKLGDQVVVTADGCRVLAPFPFDVALLS